MNNFFEGPKSQISTLFLCVDGCKNFLVPFYGEEKKMEIQDFACFCENTYQF
jgi:hypothetical protein